MTSSIRKQLLVWLLIPLSTIAASSTFIAYNAAILLAREIYDKGLLNSADSVIARVRHKGGKVLVDLPPAAQSILKHNYRDTFFYQIYTMDGKRIAGDGTLPFDRGAVDFSQPHYSTRMLDGKEVRVLTILFPVASHFADETPDADDDDVPKPETLILEVAETRNARREIVTHIVVSVLLPQLILIICGGIAVWFGIKQGLYPLQQLSKVLASRSPTDLSPVSESTAPIEVRPLVGAINGLLRMLNDEIEKERRFVANAAHQLRTPLAGLKTYADLALKMNEDPSVHSVLAQLHTGINRMSNLIARLLTLARSEPGVASQAAKQSTDLSAIVSGVTEDLVPLSIEKKVDLGFESPHEAIIIDGDPVGLRELVTNIIENAVIYNQEGGKVTVKLSKMRSPILSVEDNGPGIPVAERELVFERFYRILRDGASGSGLGLSIVKEIANSHGAKVEVHDGSDGVGTCFTVIFPETVIGRR